MKITVLEAASLGPSVSLDGLGKYGAQIDVYPMTSYEEIGDRVKDADILIINKLKMNAETLKTAEKLKFIAITATGKDPFDVDYLNSRGIRASNITGYASESVAQHTLTLLLALLEKLSYYNSFVKSGAYAKDTIGSYYQVTWNEIRGKRWGIVGLGNIGRRVAELAEAFGAEVVYYSVSGSDRPEAWPRVSFEELLTTSDIITLHTPLNDASRHLFNYDVLKQMKPTAVLVNTARGPVVEEAGLVRALKEQRIAGAALDVMEQEPLPEGSPLAAIADDTRLLLTPHIGWASAEARQRAMEEVILNIDAFLEGRERNPVC